MEPVGFAVFRVRVWVGRFAVSIVLAAILILILVLIPGALRLRVILVLALICISLATPFILIWRLSEVFDAAQRE